MEEFTFNEGGNGQVEEVIRTVNIVLVFYNRIKK